MPRAVASPVIPLVASLFVLGSAGVVKAIERMPNPSGRVVVGEVGITLEQPPEGFEQTVQVRSSCDGAAFRTYTISPTEWGQAGDYVDTLPIAEGDCTLDARLLPGQEPWESVAMNTAACVVRVESGLTLDCGQ